MKFVEYTDSEIMWMDLANTIAGELNRALMTHDRVSLAVPGGTTPGPAFDVLSAISLDWDRVDVILTDERWVPEDSPRSNARLLRERLLIGKAAAAHFIPYYTGGAEPDVDLVDKSDEVRVLTPLTFLLLGMGADMHTASLFPGADRLAKALGDDAPELMAIHVPGSDEPRVTLSANVLNGAMQKHLVILGDEKRESLEKAVQIGDPLQAPVAAVLDGLTVHWARD
jgi:6-phosphogluconolactonase